MCGFSAGPQSNWLITQPINWTVNGTRLPQVSVFVQFDCDIMSNCQGTLSIHKYETSSINTIEARKVENYLLVKQISLTDIIVNETFTVNFNSNFSSFYLAIQDKTSCTVVSRLIVFYYVCPNTETAPIMVRSLIRHPGTIAPMFPSSNGQVATRSASSTIVNASCVKNAEPENDSELCPKLACSPGGIWSFVPGAGCRCLLGHYNDSGRCIRKLAYGVGKNVCMLEY